uniref:Secreted protein n=1 Tax=Caenorhabditis tropicalis TaxID=1561998 RepID=A0A1I7TPR7_9PELO
MFAGWFLMDLLFQGQFRTAPNMRGKTWHPKRITPIYTGLLYSSCYSIQSKESRCKDDYLSFSYSIHVEKRE